MNLSRVFWIGFIVFIAAIAFIFGYLYLQDIRFQKSNYAFVVIFDNVQGLNEGDKVTMLGKRIGKVSKTHIKGKKIAVELSIDNEYEDQLPIDSEIEVKSEGFLGEKYISIKPGEDFKHFLLSGVTVNGTREVDFSEITPGIVPITKDLGAVARRLKATLGEDEKENIQKAIKNIEVLTDELTQLIKSAREYVSVNDKENLSQFFENLKTSSESFKGTTDTLKTGLRKELNKLDNILSDVQKFTVKSDEFGQAIDKLKLSSESFSQMTQSLNKSVVKLEGVVDKLENGEGTLPKLINDKSAYNNMDSLFIDMRNVVSDFKNNPSKYIKAYLKSKK